MKKVLGKSSVLYTNINWKLAIYEVKSKQENLVKAFRVGNLSKVKGLQHSLLNSHSVHAVAVRDVINSSGSKVSGLDGVVIKTDKDKNRILAQTQMIMYNLKCYEPGSLRKVYVLNKDGSERLIGVLNIIDRIIQKVFVMAIDPIAEEVSDFDSFGYRKGRNAFDAVLSIRGKLNHPSAAQFVFEGTISDCFKRMDHNFALGVCPLYRKVDIEVMRKWLKLGVDISGSYIESEIDGPQGSVIGPILCNLVLNGLESKVKEMAKKYRPKYEKQLKTHVVRFGSVFVIINPYKDVLKKMVPGLKEFLGLRGLSLSEHLCKVVTVYQGFDFLGFHFCKRTYDYRKRADLKKHTGKERIIVMPVKKSLKNFRANYTQIIKRRFRGSIARLILELNPVLRRWAYYYSFTNTSVEIVRKEQHFLFKIIFKWLKKRHPTRSSKWVVAIYFKSVFRSVRGRVLKREWTLFSKALSGEGEVLLFDLSTLKAPGLKRLSTKGFNPYTEKGCSYYESRRKTFGYVLQEQKNQAWKRQGGFCSYCKGEMYSAHLLELHHNPPLYLFEGKRWKGVLELMHKECHIQYHKKCRDGGFE